MYGGWLGKKGRGRGLAGFFGVFRPWSNRYVTVNIATGLLTYYENEVDGENKCNEKGCRFPMKTVHRQNLIDDVHRTLIFHPGHVHLRKSEISVDEGDISMQITLKADVRDLGGNQENVASEGEVLHLRVCFQLSIQPFREATMYFSNSNTVNLQWFNYFFLSLSIDVFP